MSETPTKRVKHKDSGDEMLINVEDFDPETHEEIKVERVRGKSADDSAEKKPNGGKK